MTISVIETIKAKVDVADEISLVVTLQRSGKTLKGLCPFHNERSPSFYVYPESQSWHCFGCHENGDIFTFVQKQQGFDFGETLQYLAQKAGISAEEYRGERTEEERETSVARERLLKLNEEALLWFHQILLRSKDAAGARGYVQSRGISSETVMAFGLGYANDHWDTLTRYLLGQGYSEQELVSGGLARWRESNAQPGIRDGIYDYFRNRLIFPIRDIRGRAIGFGGRALGESKPKYLNSPQTLLFEKNTVLYAIDLAKDAIKQVGQVVIVEGYVDAVIAHQYGTKQTVACIGSAITEKHIQQLKKMTRQVTLALDPDAAGSAATEQGIKEALKGFDKTIVPVPLAGSAEGMRTRTQPGQGKFRAAQPRGIIRLEEQVDAVINVLQLPEGEDPDEVIRRDFSAWMYAVAHPLALIDYYFVVKTADLNLRDAGDKAEAAKRLLPVVATISDRIKRDAYLRKLSSMISIEERSLYAELQRVLRGQNTPGTIANFSDKGSRRQDIREQNSPDELPPELRENGEATQSVTRQPQTVELDRNRRNTLKWEDYLIGLLLQNPGLVPHVCGIINDGDFAGTDTRELYRTLNSVYQRDASPSLQPLEQYVSSALLPAVSRANKCVESRSPLDGAGLVKEAVQCAYRLKRMRLVQLNMELKYPMQEAADAGDMTVVRQLWQQVQNIQRQLRAIDAATPLQG